MIDIMRFAEQREGRLENGMSCRSCQSDKQTTFQSEICIHFPGINNLGKPPVLAFPTLVVCLDCGFAEFRIAETELRMLSEDAAA